MSPIQPPAIVECHLRHPRTAPISHPFTSTTYRWLVDLDHLPRLPWWLRLWARVEARDHVGDPRSTIGSTVDAFVAEHAVDLGGAAVRRPTNARSLGYVFNPLTLYRCRYGGGSPAAIIAEVHHTYGGRFGCPPRPEHDRARVATRFYGPPLFPVDGAYRMYRPEPTGGLAVSIRRHRDGGRPFGATPRGSGCPAITSVPLRSAVRHPFVSAAVSARIPRRGVHLLSRGRPVIPRPEALKGAG